jgi:N6-adenosine-specific RNA methylase IME4
MNQGYSDGYKVIYADPPWPVSKVVRKCRPNQKSELDYPTMTIKQITDLPVSLISAPDCVLFLWTTHKYLPDSFSILSKWGFKYQRTITWDKGNGMCLFGFHHRTEFLLFGYRGRLEMYPRRPAFPTIVSEKSPRHSEKPQIFRDLIAPYGIPRIELFARIRVPGWDAWGNEVISDVVL